MSDFTGVTIINKPVELCFDFITAPAYWPSYHPDSVRVRPEEGEEVNLYNPLELGKKCIETAKVGYFQMDLHWETTTFDRGAKFVITGHAIFGLEMQITYNFSEVCEGVSSFERTFKYTYKPLIMKIVNFFYLKTIACEDGVEALKDSKKVLEAMPCNVSRYEKERQK